uniref:Dynamin N-terminal domain-containing protein n=1 Tax=Oncorhynchus kisutch TaxID=8019 RepID=A0A8C7IPM6_ONCKI
FTFKDALCRNHCKVRSFIELIDYLRSIGIEKDLPLPSIAVVGDQSSGKSSVLEALSGVALPRGNGEYYVDTMSLSNGEALLLLCVSYSITC